MDNSILPCCYLAYTVRRLPFIRNKKKLKPKRLIIGNVMNESVKSLWIKSENFRKLLFNGEIHPICQMCALI